LTEDSASGAANSSLGGPMARGAAWMVTARWCVRLIGLGSTLILARLLTPEDFGLVAIATSAFAVLDALTDSRFGTALIKYQDATTAEYDAAWTFNILRGLFLAAVTAAAGPVLGYFYKDPRLVNIALVIACVAVIQGAFNIGTIDFSKNLRFDLDFKFLVFNKLLSSATTAALAFAFRNYWALIVGNLAGNVFGLVLSFVLSPFRPKLGFSAGRRLFGFSVWLMAGNAVTSVGQQMTNIILGAFVPAREVGIYYVGRDLGTMVTGELVTPISRVLFPGFSKITGESRRLLEAYQRSIELLCAIGLPLGIGFALVAREATLILLGEQWIEAIPVIQTIAVLTSINLISSGSSSILPALGRTKQVFQINLASVLLALPVITFLSFRYGLTGALVANAIGGVFWAWTHIAAVARALSISAWDQVAQSWRSFASTAFMAIGVFALGTELGGEANIWISLASKVLLGAVLYPACHLALWFLCKRPPGPERLLMDALAQLRLKIS